MHACSREQAAWSKHHRGGGTSLTEPHCCAQPPDTNLHNYTTTQQQPLHTLKEAAIIAKSIARTPTVATSATRGAWASDDRSRARARHVKKRALDVNRLRRCTDAVMEQLKKAPTTVGGTVLVLCEDENPYVWKVMQASV